MPSNELLKRMAIESLRAFSRSPPARPIDPGSIPERIALLKSILLRDQAVTDATAVRIAPIRAGNTRL